MNMEEIEKPKKSFSDVLSEADEEVKSEYQKTDRNTVLNAIDWIINILNGRWPASIQFSDFSADDLSSMWGRLAVLRSSLISHKIESFRQKLVMLEYIKAKTAQVRTDVKENLVKEAKEKGDKAPTADDIKAELERQLVKSSLLLAFHSAEYEKIQSYWYSIPDILYRIEQRINIIIWDKSTSKFIKDAGDVEIPEMGSSEYNYWDI